MPRGKGTNGSVASGASTALGKSMNTVATPLMTTPKAPNVSGSPTQPKQGVPINGVQPMRSAAPAPKPAAPASCWNNNTLLKNTLVQNAAKSRAPSLFPPRAQQTPSALANNMNKMSLNPSASVWNPSIGPTPSKVSMMSMSAWKARMVGQSRAGSTYSVAPRQPFYNQICRASNYTRRNFKKGDIIAIPFHTPNTNPNVDPVTDDQWTMTVWGPVYSKRRMVIVLWVYERDMFCLPLYTFGKTGLSNKGQNIKHEYVSVKNAGMPHVNQGIYPRVEVRAYKKPMDEDSTVHISGGLRVGCNEDITWAGRMTKESYMDLVALWQDLSENAQGEPWRD